MSSTVEIRWCVAPASRIAARTCASLPARECGACGAGVLVDRRRRQRRAGRARPRRRRRGRCAASMPHCAERLAQLARRRQAEDAAVDARPSSPRADVRAQPVDVLRAAAASGSDELDAAAGELALGLDPVAAVGEQRGALGGDDQRRHRAGEARRPLARLPALGQVLGQVRVARRHDDGGASRRRAARPGCCSMRRRAGEVRVSMRCPFLLQAQFRAAAATPARRRLGDDARAALVREVRPGPVDHHHQPVAKADQEVDVREQPEQPGREAAEAQRAEARHGELDDRGLAADGRQVAVVAVAERAASVRRAAGAAMLAAAVRPICLAAGLTPGTGVGSLRPVAERGGEVADHRDLGMAGQAQVGRDDDAAGAVERRRRCRARARRRAASRRRRRPRSRCARRSARCRSPSRAVVA